jgi:hypothetical protein
MATNDPLPPDSEVHLFATVGFPRGLSRFFPPATRAELWCGLVLIGLSLLGAAWFLKCRSDALALQQDSAIVQGKVVRLWITTGKGASFHVTYEYPASVAADAPVLKKEALLYKEHFDRMKEGGPSSVRVCRSDPANHQVVGAPPRIWSTGAALLLYLGFLALLMLAGVINLWWWWVSYRRNRPVEAFLRGFQA